MDRSKEKVSTILPIRIGRIIANANPVVPTKLIRTISRFVASM